MVTRPTVLRPTGARGAGEELRSHLNLTAVGGPEMISGVTLDSRQVLPGDLYAALPGFQTHGARFAQQAIEAGAAAVLTDQAGLEIIKSNGEALVPILVVPDPRGKLGAIASWLYGNPAQSMAVAGITGTNGKTTTAYLLDAALRASGRNTGVIGTVATQIGDLVLPATRTTPEAPDLHAVLAVMAQNGVTAVTMEVSSHALELGRADGVRFTLAIFTNLTQDHLDFHGDMASYFKAKTGLFLGDRTSSALICVDDQWGQRLAGMTHAAGVPTSTYAITTLADWTADEIEQGSFGTQSFRVRGPGGVEIRSQVGLPGDFNVANALAALASAAILGVDPVVAGLGIASCSGVPGRMERIQAGQSFLAIVDYAHTPDAVQRAIEATRAAIGESGRVIVVLGCGGDRDPEKRASMGRVAALGADVLVITDDNPRSEAAVDIRAAIKAGAATATGRPRAAAVLDEGDRSKAIRLAVAQAGPADAILVLGKGHEQGQEAAGVVLPFDDREQLRNALEASA